MARGMSRFQRIKAKAMRMDEVRKTAVAMLDRGGTIIDLFTKGGLAYLGYNATKHWTGALTALILLKLATSDNLAAGAAGVAGLTAIGATNIFAAIPPPTIAEQR